MAGKKGMKRYRIEEKLEAVRLYLEDGKTQRWIAEHLGLSRKELVETWVRHYRREGTMAFGKVIGRPRKMVDREAYIARLEMENELLKKYHTELCTQRRAKRNIG
jgi:transposase-like protein